MGSIILGVGWTEGILSICSLLLGAFGRELIKLVRERNRYAVNEKQAEQKNAWVQVERLWREVEHMRGEIKQRRHEYHVILCEKNALILYCQGLEDQIVQLRQWLSMPVDPNAISLKQVLAQARAEAEKDERGNDTVSFGSQ